MEESIIASELVVQMEPPVCIYIYIYIYIYPLRILQPFWPLGGPALRANVACQIGIESVYLCQQLSASIQLLNWVWRG